MIHVMFDLETWGTEPGCDIRSIGAVVFYPDEEEVSTDPAMQFYRVTEGGAFYGLKRDDQTVLWWADQSISAQAAFNNPVPLDNALIDFGIWLNQITGVTSETGGKPMLNLRMWSHGAAFDGPILAAAYKACGMLAPWHYRAYRDTRTCFDIAGIDDHTAFLERFPGPLGIHHHALDDAICQALAVCHAYQLIKERYGND